MLRECLLWVGTHFTGTEVSLSVGNSNIQIGKPTRPWPRTDGGVPKAMTLRRDEAVN